MQRLCALVTLTLVWLLPVVAHAAKGEKLVVYTSMKESMIDKLRDAFVAKHPEVEFDYYSADAGKIMAKIAAERQSGSVVTDILWTSEIPDFYQLKEQGFLEPYVSPEAGGIVSPVKDPEGFFTPARLGTLGLAYNTKAVKAAPATWADAAGPAIAGGFGIANPALSYPLEMLVVPSPVAIVKGTKNLGAARKFVDFLLSKEGQAIIAASGTLPIRDDVPLPAGSPLPPPSDAVKRAMQVDYLELIQSKEAIIKKFTELMQAK